MTPAEHYTEAEKWLEAAKEQMKQLKGYVADSTLKAGDIQVLVPSINLTLATAQVHAILATAPRIPGTPT